MQPVFPRRIGVRPQALAAALLASLWAGGALGQEFLPPPRTPEPSPPAEAVAAPYASTPAAEMVAEVRIVGNDTTSTVQVSSNLKTRAGRPFDASVVQNDVAKLANLGWFVDVKALYETTPKGRVVIFQVVERPTIRWVKYIGNDSYTPKKLDKQTGLKVGGAVDPYSVQDGARKISEFYKGKGYNNVQVTILEGNKATDIGVTYLIHEGVAQKIWSTKFIGNDGGFVSDSRLRTMIKSKPPIAFYFKGQYDEEKIKADEDAITAYYRAHGFFQARVSHKSDRNEKGNWVTLNFIIHEGQQYHVRNVNVLGNTKFEQNPLMEKLKLQTGQAFEQDKMEADAKWLQELYGSQGYVFADVKPETVYLEEPGLVDLQYHIQEGERFRVGRVFVHIGGDNPHTRIQTALNRVTVLPGQIMDIREVHASERRLLASQVFEADAQSGKRPKITYHIPEDEDAEFAERPRKRVRGQSPDQPVGPGVLPPPSALPAAPMDLHVFCDDEAHFQRWQAMELQPDEVLFPPKPPVEEPVIDEEGDDEESDDAAPLNSAAPAAQAEPVIFRGQSPPPAAAANSSWAPVRPQAWQVARPPVNTYDQIRGQSPAGQTYVNQAYSQVPTTAQPSSPYGGQMVRPTGPESAPAQTGVQPVQYSSEGSYSPNLQPPAGSIYPQPLSPYGPLPGLSLDPTNPLYPTPGIPGFPERTVDIDISGTETQTGRLMLGLGVNSNAGIVGNIVVDERNFDWTKLPTSWEDVRNGTAWRGAGQRFTINASPGSQVSRYMVSFQEPYLLDRPLSLSLSGSYYNRIFNDWTEQRLGGRISLGKQWVERDLSAIVTYRGENVTLFNPSVPRGAVPQLDRALGSNVLHGFRASVINDTRDSAFLATQGHYLELGGEQVIGSFSYPRVDMDFRQYWMLAERPDHSGRHVLSLASTVGYSGTQTPIYENFFAGGFSTLRGFYFRGASPVVLVGQNQKVIVGGPFEWINSLQYMFPIMADDMLHGVVFTDFGTVNPSVELKNFRVAVGTGLRITVPAMGPAPIALDFAWAVDKASFDQTQVFSFSLGFSR